MTFAITVEGEWGSSTIDCRPDELLLDAMVRQSLPVAFCCKAGLCGMCKAELAAGQVEQLPHSPRALPAAESARGEILTCCARPVTDCTLRPLNMLDNFGSGFLGATAGVETVEASVVRGQHVLRLRSESAGAISRYQVGHWAWLRALEHPHAALLGCFVAQDPADPSVALFAVRSAGQFGGPWGRGSRLYLEGPQGTAVELQGPIVLVLDEHGLPLVDGLNRVADYAPGCTKMAVIVSSGAALERSAVVIGALAQQWHMVHPAGIQGLRADLESLAVKSAAVGQRLRLLVRGAPHFQDGIRRLAFGTGIRGWDVAAEGMIDLAQNRREDGEPDDEL